MDNIEMNDNFSSMTNLENIQEGGSLETPSFFKHMFNYDKNTENILLNTIQ